MQVASLNDCREIGITSDQILQLIESGAVDTIDVNLKVNCCNTYNFTIFPGVENCVWESGGDINANGILFPGQPLEAITSISGRFYPVGDDPVVGPIVEGDYDLTNPSHVAQLEADVADWFTANSVLGNFDVEIEDGVFKFVFTNLSSNFVPTLWQATPVGSGVDVITNTIFRCDGELVTGSSELPNAGVPTIQSDWWGLSTSGITIYPGLMGKDKFPDGVYSVQLKVNSSDGTSITLTRCLLVDCELKCKIARKSDPNAALYYYLLKELEDCDCDCEIMCEILSMQIDPD